MAQRPFWTDANITDQWGLRIFLNRSLSSAELGKHLCRVDTRIFKFRIGYYRVYTSTPDPYVIKGIKTKRFKTIYYIECASYIHVYIIYRWLLLNFSRKTNNSKRNFYHIGTYSKTVLHIQLTNTFLALRLIFWIKLKKCHTKWEFRNFIKYLLTTSQISQNHQRNYEYNMLIYDKKYII